MRIIHFKENQKEIWNKFITENNSESFLQSWEWGRFQKNLGRKIWRIGIIEDDLTGENRTKVSNINLVVLALVIKLDLPFGKSYFYCPRGPVVKESGIWNLESGILDLLFNEIKKIAKKEKSLFLRFDPPIEMNQESRIKNYEYFTNFKKSLNEIQPRNTLILDLTKSEEDLLKEMKQKTRYNIRLAGRKELEIRNWEIGRLGNSPDKKFPPYSKEGQGWLRCENRENFEKDFEKFWELVEETSARDKFKSHNKNYYWKMLEVGVQNFEPLPKGDIPKCRLQAKLYLAEYNNKIIAANIVLYFGDMAVYLHGASSNKHRNLMAPYLLQWRQIIDAKKAGCKKYDFWGVSQEAKLPIGSLASSKNDWQGITRFKKGFGGYEKNYIGAYDMIFSNIGYQIYRFARFIKRTLNNQGYKIQ